MPWLIADNGVRNPKRLKDGLEVLVNSQFHGDFSKHNEEGMALLLDSKGVISIQTNSDNTVARKWRVNLIRLGFIDPDTHIVTENGRRLINSSSLPEQEECFLRALLVHQLPSSVHPLPDGDIDQPFNPLRIVLEVISELKKRGETPSITKNEMASIIIIHYSMGEIPRLVDEVIAYRNAREVQKNKKKFDREYRERSASFVGRVNASSLNSYADVNMRYLKLTGLFVEEGISKLSIAKHKETIVLQILRTQYQSVEPDKYQSILAKGASLPTDNESEAIKVIKSLYELLVHNGEDVAPLPNFSELSVKDLSQLRIKLENKWIHTLEKKYANDQVNQWKDILDYMTELQKPNKIGKRGSLVPSGEGPAYLEWTIWRAFLAINSIQNYPWEARKFTIDRSFKPVRHAAGGDADMIFEFEDFVFVVEVTLTSSSRQEAAEGEPVRRHVANYVDDYELKGKRVYGLFIANNIDTNTAETFRIGVWYRKDDSQLSVQIVPITLEDFSNLFEKIFKANKGEEARYILKQLFNDLLSFSNHRAPDWKRHMSNEIQRKIQAI
ncbi:AlwI family type II restriction endonuclease [Halobacillus karajensis]|uniref:AlwI restriction endonuclease n=1 Tax=Halobacillus karajensis TaxID=195088 RepID=A0A059NXW1_9BACI|nr:AlwI family type II restriction endonuclease [Halobacillus karajensis]CDQ20894.1 AlwI restriction endonuclease [Halobacillus karajensis]CDQ23635.1 AlwI restriction endonuclease [Halobacillus karajensis]CDQ27113.1 AlwI restriction endonuclease [Halobacillus karajensis]